MTITNVAVALLLAITTQLMGQSTFWTNGTNPAIPEATNDGQSVSLGLKFYTDVPGSVTGVRFYKGAHNTGTHVGSLWSSTGARLASVSFSGETASGWQQANFASPVNILANTTYVISYFAPAGAYAVNKPYTWSTVNAGPLHVSGSSPGVFTYGLTPVFPLGTWQSSNYWVDVIFRATGISDPSIPTVPSSKYNISGTVRGAGATVTLSGVASRSTSTDGAGNYSFTGLSNGAYVVAASQSGYTFTPPTASISLNGASLTGVNFTATAVPPASQHTVSLSWRGSTSGNVSGYNVYRAQVAGGAFTKLNTSPLGTTAYVDNNVTSGRTYYYVATAVDSNNKESPYSNQAVAPVPTP